MESQIVDYTLQDIKSVLSIFGISLDQARTFKDRDLEPVKKYASLTIDQAIAKMRSDLVTDGKSANTLKRYDIEFKMLVQFLETIHGPNCMIIDITVDDINRYLEYRRIKKPGHNHHEVTGEVAEGTISVTKAVLRKIFKVMEDSSPAKDLKFKRSNGKVTYLREHECGVLLDVATKKRRFKLRDYTLVYLFLATGSRIEEVRNILVADINFNSKRLMLRGVKGGGNEVKPRYLPIMGDLFDALMTWVTVGLKYEKTESGLVIPGKDTVSEYLFPNLAGCAKGNQMSQENIRGIIEGLFEAMNRELKNRGLPPNEMDLTPHSCRHTFALMSLDAGISPDIVQIMMGHNSIGSLSCYTNRGLEETFRIAATYNPLISLQISDLHEFYQNRGGL